MGAGLVQRALLEPVDPDAKCILVAMALVALDVPREGQEAGIYWGGREYLMQVAFGCIPDPGTEEYDLAARKLKRRITKLTKAGSLELISPATGRHRARYRVLPDPVDNVRLLPNRGSRNDPLSGHQTTPY